MSEDAAPPPNAPIVQLPLAWDIPLTMQSRYASNIIVQPGLSEIYIMFFEPQIPPLGGTPEENRKTLEKQGSIRAECVARIVVSPEQMPGMIEAMRKGLESYQTSKPQGAASE